MTTTERHDPEGQRYELVVDGRAIAVAEYRVEGDVVVMHHTFTDPAHRGHGYAARVVGFALDDLRARGVRVDPQCWFVADFIDAHPEYRDLLVPR